MLMNKALKKTFSDFQQIPWFYNLLRFVTDCKSFLLQLKLAVKSMNEQAVVRANDDND